MHNYNKNISIVLLLEILHKTFYSMSWLFSNSFNTVNIIQALFFDSHQMPTLNFNEKLRISFDKHQLDVEDEQHSYTSLTQPNISCEEGDSL